MLGAAANAAANAATNAVNGLAGAVPAVPKKSDTPTIAFSAPLPKEIKLNDRKGKVRYDHTHI